MLGFIRKVIHVDHSGLGSNDFPVGIMKLLNVNRLTELKGKIPLRFVG